MMDAPPVSVSDSRRSQRSWPLRFSLWTLCLVVAVACVGAAWVGMRKREGDAMAKASALMAQVELQQAEINRLRAEIGYLTIGDRTKVHVVQLQSGHDYRWKWRVYLPPGKSWSFCSALGTIPRQGLEGIPHVASTVDHGEFTVEACFDRDSDGQRRFVVAIHGHSRTSQSIDEQQFEQFKKRGFSATGIGSTKTEVLDPAGPIVLIRLRQHRPVPGSPGSLATSEDPEFGFVLWFE